MPAVLIVEDDAMLRALGIDIFSEAGFHVMEAPTGDHALSLLENEPQQIHVLFTDVHMPGSMDGLSLARSVFSRWPHIKIIIVSGEVYPAPHELPDGSRFHRKPYDPDAVVRQALELTAA